MASLRVLLILLPAAFVGALSTPPAMAQEKTPPSPWTVEGDGQVLTGNLDAVPLDEALLQIVDVAWISLAITPQRLAELSKRQVTARFKKTNAIDVLRALLVMHRIPWHLVGGNVVVVEAKDPVADMRREKAELTLELELRELEGALRGTHEQPAKTHSRAPDVPKWPLVGQRFVFQLEGELHMTWEVTDVLGPRVSYTITTRLGDTPIGKPIAQVWSPSDLPPTDATPVNKRLGGVPFDVLEVRSEAGVNTWIAVQEGRMRFPGVLWMQKDGKATMKLVEVQAP